MHHLGNEFQARGHEVTIFTYALGVPNDATYAVRRLGGFSLSERRILRLTLGSALLNTLPGSGFDVVNLHGDDWFYFRRPVPTVRTFHGSALSEARTATSKKRRIEQSVVFFGELLASHLATAAYSDCGGMRPAYGLSGYLPMGGGIRPRNPEVSARHKTPVVLFVGSWEGRKRGRFLANLFKSFVRPRFADAELWMVADHCVEGEGVKWIRSPDDAALSALYSEAWLFCLPSTYEGFGLPYVEAMAHGTPVVASPNPGSRYVSGGGRWAVLSDDTELGPAICELLRDATRRSVLAMEGRRRAEGFTWAAAAEAHLEAFAQAANRFHGSS